MTFEPTVSERSIADALRDARALIEDPTRWTKGRYFRTATDGRKRYCALGAISAAALNPREGWFSRGALTRITKHCPVAWNDAPERTHAEVLDAFDKAIAMAEQDAA